MGTAYAVWMACPTEAGMGWLPWQPVAGVWQHPLVMPCSAAEAHAIARTMRSTFPGSLLAVRPAAAGEPLWPDAMADHYDLPPYV